MAVTVAGAAAVRDYIFQVDRLPERGEIRFIQAAPNLNAAYCGGSAPNIACSLRRLGETVRLIYPVGNDFTGSECERAWTDLGIDLHHLIRIPDQPSGFAYLFFDTAGDSLCLAFPGAASADQTSDLSLDELDGWIVVAPVLTPLTRAVLEAAAIGKLRVVASGIGSADLIPFFPYLSALVINRVEAQQLCAARQDDDIAELAGEWPDLLFYVTSGSAGSTVYFERRSIAIPCVQSDGFVDSTGAGDAYTAGVVAGLMRGFDPVAAGYLGAANASFAVEAWGAQTNLPTWDGLIQRLRAQGYELPQPIHHGGEESIEGGNRRHVQGGIRGA